eukprot:690377-Lingulodinium_polyedra.AAC.1
MMRSKRRFAVATAREPHGRELRARTENRPAHEMRTRATCETLRPRNVDATASLRNVSKTLRNTT